MIATKEKGSVKLPLIANNTTAKDCTIKQRYKYIPLDWIKCEVIGLSREFFVNKQDLEFTPVLERGSYDSIKFEYVKRQGMFLKVPPKGRIEFSGSLHKYWNSGEQNHNDFDFKAYLSVLEKLERDFFIRPENLRLIQVEYGFNITPPIETNLVLNGLLLLGNKEFAHKINSRRGNFYSCERQRYEFKVYNKSLQFDLPYEVLRIEVKQKNWSEYRLKGLNTLEDFNNCDKGLFLSNLIEKLDDVVLYDSLIKNEGIKYSNINYWREILKKSRTTLQRKKDKLLVLSKSRGIDLKQKLIDEVVRKCNELQNVTNYKFRKKCALTGLDISSQREDSFLLSHRGLRELLKTDKQSFEKVKDVFLSNRYKSSNLDIQIKEIAHSLRCKYNYQTKKNQLTLFG